MSSRSDRVLGVGRARERALLAVPALALALLGAARVQRPAVAAAGGAAPAGVLRVCADPNNLPFSDSTGRGFDNRVAALLAAELHDSVRYTWWAQRRGFVRNTLKARRCDVVAGVPAGDEQMLTTAPYYRSTYVFVTRRGTPPVRSFDDPRLRRLRVGIHIIGASYNSVPPGVALARRGITRNVVGYSIYGDYAKPSPPSALITGVARGDVDVAVAWGPLAGYYARRSPVPLVLTPVAADPSSPAARFVYPMALGVRRGDTALRVALERAVERRRADLQQILRTYGVPLCAPETPGGAACD
ncbi:amino acid ABC transporter substrate-binding protein [Gemmatimonadetes bacterium T265]|nr:amino acid ABC transporter substrate-binding protein [Gemmatimonadetes bacterium T265]